MASQRIRISAESVWEEGGGNSVTPGRGRGSDGALGGTLLVRQGRAGHECLAQPCLTLIPGSYQLEHLHFEVSCDNEPVNGCPIYLKHWTV